MLTHVRNVVIALAIVWAVAAGTGTEARGKAFPGRFYPSQAASTPTPTPVPQPSIAGAASSYALAGTGTPIVLAPDATCTNGQILIAATIVNVGSASATGATISGGTNPWNVIQASGYAMAAGDTYASWWHLCNGSEPSTYSFGNDSNPLNATIAMLIRVTNANTTNPIDVHLYHDFGGTTNTSFSMTGLGPGTQVGDLPIVLWASGFGNGFTGPTGGFSAITNASQLTGPGLQGYSHANTTDTTSTFSSSVTVSPADQATYDAMMILPATLATPTPSPSPTPLNIARVAVQCCGGVANDTPTPSAAVPYVYMFHNPDPSVTNGPGHIDAVTALHNAGALNIQNYVDDARVYVGDHEYNNVNNGQWGSARAANCGGQFLLTNQTTPASGYMTDPYQANTLNVYNDDVAYRYVLNGGANAGSPYYNYIFLDDFDSYSNGLAPPPTPAPSPPPCHAGSPWSSTGVDTAYSTLVSKILVPTGILGGGQQQPKFTVNALGVIQGGSSAITALMAASNLYAGMCENCFNSGATLIGGSTWVTNVNAQITTINLGKGFWDWENGDNSTGATAITHRMYYYGTLMLNYDPNYLWFGEPDMYGVTISGAPSLHVFPEFQLTAYAPLVTGVTSVSQEQIGSTAVYFREYTNCYLGSYNGTVWSFPVLNGSHCAFVVNTGNTNVAFTSITPSFSNSYSNHLVLSGTGILDGGTATVTAGGPSGNLSALTAQVFIQ